MLILQGLVLVRINKQGKQLSSDELHKVCITHHYLRLTREPLTMSELALQGKVEGRARSLSRLSCGRYQTWHFSGMLPFDAVKFAQSLVEAYDFAAEGRIWGKRLKSWHVLFERRLPIFYLPWPIFSIQYTVYTVEIRRSGVADSMSPLLYRQE